MDQKSREGAGCIITRQLAVTVSRCDKHTLPQVTLHDNRVATLCHDHFWSMISRKCFTESLLISLNKGRGKLIITLDTSKQTDGEVISPIGWTGKHTLTGIIMPSIVGHYKRKFDNFTQRRVLPYSLCVCREADCTGCLVRSCKYITHNTLYEVIFSRFSNSKGKQKNISHITCSI